MLWDIVRRLEHEKIFKVPLDWFLVWSTLKCKVPNLIISISEVRDYNSFYICHFQEGSVKKLKL